MLVSTHSRPKAAGTVGCKHRYHQAVSTHSRPKAAGTPDTAAGLSRLVSTHSRPKAAGGHLVSRQVPPSRFQLTAARRRLALWYSQAGTPVLGFNSQPPEGGWLIFSPAKKWASRFNSQPPEGGWTKYIAQTLAKTSFNSQPPEGGWHRHCGL